MEEKEIISLRNSKMYVARIGRWMNIFSIISGVGMLFIVAGGIVLLYVSNTMDEATPYYLDNVVGLGGIGLIIFAGAIIPALMFMRRAVAEANRIKGVQEVYPVVDFLRETKKLWRYTTIVLIVVFVVGLIASAVAAMYYFPLRGSF